MPFSIFVSLDSGSTTSKVCVNIGNEGNDVWKLPSKISIFRISAFLAAIEASANLCLLLLRVILWSFSRFLGLLFFFSRLLVTFFFLLKNSGVSGDKGIKFPRVAYPSPLGIFDFFLITRTSGESFSTILSELSSLEIISLIGLRGSARLKSNYYMKWIEHSPSWS